MKIKIVIGDKTKTVNFRKVKKYKCYNFVSLDLTSVFDNEDCAVPMYNGKVVCTSADGKLSFIFTKGKIYDIKNGKLFDDEGKLMLNNIEHLYQIEMKIKGLSFIPYRE